MSLEENGDSQEETSNMLHDRKDGQVFNRETNTSETIKSQTVIADVTVGAKTSLKA